MHILPTDIVDEIGTYLGREIARCRGISLYYNDVWEQRAKDIYWKLRSRSIFRQLCLHERAYRLRTHRCTVCGRSTTEIIDMTIEPHVVHVSGPFCPHHTNIITQTPLFEITTTFM